MSNAIKPALGRSFAHCVDLHLLLSKVPKRRPDAQIFYGGAEVGVSHAQIQRIPEFVNIAEIIADRYSDRIGRWTGFAIYKGTLIKPIQQ